ncbi:MAG: CDP-diacylglycerol--serine O-phosphatidyltransferase [Bacteroidetes bacterium]|nr:MAG: CDP-diacylglycerol--serine O-phosphatidyltransferase [Bacteroidota bacterium]
MKQIPNLFTLLNLFFGSIAIILILQTNEEFVSLSGEGVSTVHLPEKITWGCLFIFLAAIVDFLDGFVARLFKATSEMGKQLDSLADVVSFGVAPGMILYQLLRISFAREADGLDASVVWLFPALVLPCATAWRLAKFNIDTEQQFSFKGLPSPASGLFVASLPLIIFYDEIGVTGILYNNWVLYLIILLLSFLMVCNLPLMSLKIKDFSVKNNLPKFILIGVGIVSAILLQWLAVPIVILAYVILSLALKNKTT